MRRSLAIGAILVGVAGPAAADIEGNRFTSSKKWGLTIDAPKSWKLSEEKSYPSVLLWMVRRDPDGKMLLSAEEVADPDAPAYASRTALVLTSIGFQVGEPRVHAGTGASIFDFDDGEVFLTQAFLVSGGIGYALTLAAPDRRTRNQHARAFDVALRAIRIRRGAAKPKPEPTESPPPPAGETPQ